MCARWPSGQRRRRTCTCRDRWQRSEEHTSELQSLRHLVCRLLLEKKKTTRITVADIIISSKDHVHYIVLRVTNRNIVKIGRQQADTIVIHMSAAQCVRKETKNG